MKIMKYALTSYNRTVYAAPAVAGLAYEKMQSAASSRRASPLRDSTRERVQLRFPG